MKKARIIIKQSQDGIRLDVAIVEARLDLSRRKIRSIIDIGGVYLNRQRVRIASRAVRYKDVVDIEYDLESLSKANKKNRIILAKENILFQDPNLLAVNKPPHMPSQATRTQAVNHIIPALNSYFSSQGIKSPSLTLVHRLDMETSGVLLLATNSRSAEWLSQAFREHRVKKCYHALCYGIPSKRHFTEDCRLSEVDNAGFVHPVERGGRSAFTSFHVKKIYEKAQISLVECLPESGRTHQIRVHLEKNDLPIVGDKKYGKKKTASLTDALAKIAADHQLLHARSICFQPGPDQDEITIHAPYPPNWCQLLAALDEKNK